MNVNRIFVGGRVGKTPEIRQTQSGKSVANFSIAVTEKYNGKEDVTWLNVTAWDKSAEFAEKWITKGARVLVVGKIQIRQYDDRDGNKRTSTDVIAQDIQVIDWPDKEGSVSRENADIPGTMPPSEEEPFDPDRDIPF
jgi:single-strand DNA-binding protein